MERKQIRAQENIELLMSSEVEIKTAELAIEIHQLNTSVHSILVWGTDFCIEEIRDYLVNKCKNVSFRKNEGLLEAKYISHNIPNIESIAVMEIYPSGESIMSIVPSVKEFLDLISNQSDNVYHIA